MLTVSVTADKFQFTPSLLHLGCLQTFTLDGFSATVARTTHRTYKAKPSVLPWGMEWIFTQILFFIDAIYGQETDINWRVMALLMLLCFSCFLFFKGNKNSLFLWLLKNLYIQMKLHAIMSYFNKSSKCCNFWAQKLSEIDCFWCNLSVLWSIHQKKTSYSY